jgi:hypothetical protein
LRSYRASASRGDRAEQIRQQSRIREGARERSEDAAIHRRLAASAARERALGKLRGADTKVKSHEKRHLAVLGGLAASGINYSYITGPNGQRFAVGGSIAVDMEPVPGNPRATIDKARRIRMAAIAVGDSSSADLRVAAKAYRMEQEAREDLREQRMEEGEQSGNEEAGRLENHSTRNENGNGSPRISTIDLYV